MYLSDSRLAGRFTVGTDKDVYGELTLSGPKTSLYLQDKKFISSFHVPGQHVAGILNDLTRVSLFNCIPTSGPGTVSRGTEKYHFCTFFPHFVVSGNVHIGANDKSIASVHFVLDDAGKLFHDFSAFGWVFDARPFIETIANANNAEHKATIGPDPQIAYFTGRKDIFSADTIAGRISASYNAFPALGSSDGIHIKNTIFVTISFREPLMFEECIARTSMVVRYLGLLIGRPQNILQLSLGLEPLSESLEVLRVYWSSGPKREDSNGEISPQSSEVLLNAVEEPEYFSRVLANWLDREHLWGDARLRFFALFDKQNKYGMDRLIGAANMFDILPSSAVPSNVQVPDALRNARDEARKLFLNLGRSPERDSVLSTLGRIETPNLKQKIRHRAAPLMTAMAALFSELPTVIDEAVNCRNHYVHGTEPRFDYNNHFQMVSFFTDSLEFIFAASDLIQAGWNLAAWDETPKSFAHPFSRFVFSYGINLHTLQILLQKKDVDKIT